jgi:hypothetical protein
VTGSILDGYPTEQAALSSVPKSLHSFLSLRDEFKGAMDPAIARAFDLLGDPDLVSNPVHTPQVPLTDPRDLENETYRWFEVNEKRGHQYLKPITARSTVLPTLHRSPTTPTTAPAASAARPVVKNQIVNLQLDGGGRLIIATNTVNNVVEAEIPRDSTRPGVHVVATRLAAGERLRGRILARPEAERYSIVNITEIESMPDA